MNSLAGFPDLEDALLGVTILADVLFRLRLPHDHGQLDSLVIQVIGERHIVPLLAFEFPTVIIDIS